MKKSSYFIIQILWSLVLSTVIWFFALKNASFDFYGNSDNSLSGMIIFFGGVVYLVLTIVQIVVGAFKVKDWHWWIILISLLIAGAICIRLLVSRSKLGNGQKQKEKTIYGFTFNRKEAFPDPVSFLFSCRYRNFRGFFFR